MVSISYGHGNLYDFGSNFLFSGSSIYTADGAGAIGATTDNALTQGDDYWNGCYIKFTSGDNIGLTREITDFDAASDTLTHDNFPQGCADGDTFLLSPWKIVEDGQTLATPTCVHGDYIQLQATGSAGNKTGYITNFTDLNLSTTLYPYVRYRCQSYSGAAKYKIVAEYDDASTSTIVDEGTSTTFIAGKTALTAAKTLDHLLFYCNSSDNVVRYDFALVYAGDFTFPNGAYGVRGTIPNRNIFLEIPSRQTDITQWLGSKNFEFNVGCDLTKGNWTKDGLAVYPTGTDYIQGQVFYDIAHNAKDEAWQWLDTGREQMKVTLEPPRFTREANGDKLTDRLDLQFKEYRLSDAGNATETYVTRWGLNL